MKLTDTVYCLSGETGRAVDPSFGGSGRPEATHSPVPYQQEAACDRATALQHV